MINLGKKQEKVNQTYNDGIAKFVKYEFGKDKFNTKLTSKTEKEINITSVEKYQALQVDTEVSRRIAIRLFPQIDDYILSDLFIIIKNKSYTISRIWHNHKKNETELSLVEVIKNEH